jgi:CO/xanthine dehydrogenase Mo-binding subunit
VGTRPIRPDGVPKVTGKALYGGDYKLAGMLYGKVLRSPHAHARIKSIDTSAAEKLPGVKSVVTSKDIPDQKFDYIGPERVAQNFWHITRNLMAREKALYEGHAVAAVAATSVAIAEEAASLIKVDYEVLPHVIDVDEAMKPDAPLLFENMITRGIEPAPTKPSNISKRLEFKVGPRSSSTCRWATSGYTQPRSAAASAARPSPIWSRSRRCCRRSRAVRCD